MRILYINSAIYDFLTATIIEGINALTREMRLELVVTAHANYAGRSQVWPREKVLRNRDSFDLIILGTNVGVDVELFHEIGNRERSICIDGSDTSELTYSPADFLVYFKRELLEPPQANVLPCPFAIERRWWQPLRSESRYFLSVCFGPTTEERAELLAFLGRQELTNTYLGAMPMTLWQQLRGVWLGQCGLSTFKWHRFAVGHNRAYYRTLSLSMLSLAPPGFGVDTGRRWEILGSGALLVAPKCQLQIPDPLIPDEHCLEYCSLDELREKLDWAYRHTDSVQRMRREARHHCLAHHTSKERARYVIQTVLKTRCADDWTEAYRTSR